MGSLLSRFFKPSTRTLLEDLQKEIDGVKKKQNIERKVKVVCEFLPFSIVCCFVCYLIFFTSSVTTLEIFLYVIGIPLSLILCYQLNKFSQRHFLQQQECNNNKLLALNERKKSLLKIAMETETYNEVNEMLRKYDPAYHKETFETAIDIEATSSSAP